MSGARASNFSKRGKSWTYKRIEAEFLGRCGRKPKSCWIASLLEPRGLTRVMLGTATERNRYTHARQNTGRIF
jgi:hypothetical protein